MPLVRRELFRQRFQYRITLIRNMPVDNIDETIQKFRRMSMRDLELLESQASSKIVKRDTFMRKAIIVRERLVITMRFLATEDSDISLQDVLMRS